MKMNNWLAFCLTIVLLSCLIIPFFAQAASTTPFYTYYSNGTYDGGLWYNSTSAGASTQTEYQDSWTDIYPDNATSYDAQTFTPIDSQTITKVQIYGRDDVGNVDYVTISLQATTANKPNGTEHSMGLLLSSEISENVSWIEFTMEPYALIAGTMYAIVLEAINTDNMYWYGTHDPDIPSVYSRGTNCYTTDNAANWTIRSADMAFRILCEDTSYEVARGNSVGNISQNIIMPIGQKYSDNYAQYTISRGALFFDTSNLLAQDNVQSATLQFYVESDDSTTDFEVTIIDGSGCNGPLQTSDYYELWLNTDNLGSVTTVGLSTTGYTTVSLNATGLTKINKDGFTKIGLRSSRDISGTTPTGDEYISIYMGESVHPPILTVTYLIGGLAIPDEMLISNVYIFASYREPGDEILVWQNTLRYETKPDVPPLEYFVVQLLAADNSVIGQTIINQWNYSPLSIYLNADVATDNMPWKSDNFSLLMTGSSLYGTPTGFTPFRYEIQPVDWRGLTNPSNPHEQLLDYWCVFTTSWLERKNGIAAGTYSTTGTAGQWCFDPYEDANDLFLEGIPYLHMARPSLFVVSPTGWTPGDNITGSYASGIYSSVWGTYWSAAFLNLAGGWGLGGQWVIGVMWGFVVASLGGLVRKQTGDPNISLVIMAFGGLIGVALGSIAMDIALVLTIIAWGAFLHNVVLSRT